MLSTGGCTTSAGRPTRAARNEDTNNPFTMLRKESGPPCTLVERNNKPMYVGFQALRVTADGCKFTANLTLEDVDASTPTAADAKNHWRETLSALGRADGLLVRQDVLVEQGSLVAVKNYAVASASLAEVGWTGFGSGNMPMEAIA